MENQYTGVFEQVGEWWVGFAEEPPGCNVQEKTLSVRTLSAISVSTGANVRALDPG
jgi:hypothetical protein